MATSRRYPKLKGLSREDAQCVGFAIQRAVSGWNCLTQYLGFRDTEDMVVPYPRVTHPPVLFEVVTDRKEGFVPSSQAKSFEMDVKLTHRRDDTFTRAFDSAAVLDKNVRAIAQDFFKDFYDIIEADALYESGKEPWKQLDEYPKPKNESLPKRITRLSKTLINNIRKGMEDGNWIDKEVQTSAPASSHAGSAQAAAPPTSSSIQPPSTAQIAPLPPLSDEELEQHMKASAKAMGDYIRLIHCSFEEVIGYHDMLFNENVEREAQLLLMH